MRPKSCQRVAIVSLVVIALLALAVVLPSAAQAKKAGTIVVGTSPDYPPFEELTNRAQAVGFDIDLVNEIGERTGYKFKWQFLEFTDLLPALTTGTLDMVASAMTITPQREEIVDFSDPYFYDPGNPDGNYYYGLAFANDSSLVDPVNEALKSIKDDGTYAMLYEEWFGVPPSVIP